MCNAVTSFVIFGIPAFIFEGVGEISLSLLLVTLLAGVVTSVSAYIKIQVLHYIDSAIFLPLFKVVGPLVVIIFGAVFFQESFTSVEWVGLIISLSVPLLLISRLEHSRQNNLTLGLQLMGVATITSAVAATLLKYASGLQDTPFWIVFFISVGIFISVLLQYSWKHRGSVRKAIVQHYSPAVVRVALLRTVFAGGGYFLTLLAFMNGGPLGIVYTINSLYILPPIILAIIFYKEHWNFRKLIAIGLSVVALVLLR